MIDNDVPNGKKGSKLVFHDAVNPCKDSITHEGGLFPRLQKPVIRNEQRKYPQDIKLRLSQGGSQQNDEPTQGSGLATAPSGQPAKLNANLIVGIQVGWFASQTELLCVGLGGSEATTDSCRK